MHVVLVEPQIAPNTGNIIRLCANAGVELHLVEPLGFALDDARLRRGGLDYHEHARVKVHPDLGSARAGLPGRCFAFSSRGTRRYSDVSYADDDVLVFGTERTGLRPAVIDGFDADAVLTIPMRPDNRSLNLANAVAIVVYEAWRQAGFAGSVGHGRHGLTSESLPSGSYDS